ncbi:discoidin domain-containing protein [Streptomyces sp. NPDC059679]|uniref:fibronectin type III domain-containing protein n=1 Tax=Streptomyces sp. NPDC059679 TaxID=3346903 RepID=UPI0036CB097D
MYGNERTFTVDLPADHTGTTVTDLVTGRELPVVGGAVRIGPKSGLVLKLSSDEATAAPPAHVDFVHTLPGDGSIAVTWQTTAGATHYEVRRATRAGGPYTLLAPKATGRYHLDRTARPGVTYYYTVTGVNEQGSGLPSHTVRAELPAPVTPGLLRSGWRDDALGGAHPGSTAVRGTTVRVLGAHGDGLGEGDDYDVLKRDIEDALHYASRPAAGSWTLTARLETARSSLTGLMLRDKLAANTRYLFFGADRDGNLVLRNRTRDSRHDWQDDKRSPIVDKLDGHTLAATPYLRLVRDFATHRVQAQTSPDGDTWLTVGTLFTPLPYAVHAGLAAIGDATFARVALEDLPAQALLVSVERDASTVTVRWNKPDDAIGFTLARSTDGEKWENVVENTRGYAHKEEGFRHGKRYYKVTATLVGGGTRTTAEPAVAVAETLAQLLARARKTPAADWTKKSYAAFTAELDRIEKAAKEAGADQDALIDAAYAAYELLVSVDTLLRKFEIAQGMVQASTIEWPGKGTKESNGWKAFDGDTATYTDTLAAESWIDIDAGDKGPITVDRIRVHPRTDAADKILRANGTVFRGSDDGGQTWTDLHTLSGISAAQWYEVKLPERASYRLIRVLDGHNGRCNLAEIEFWYLLPDTE